ncbi:flagellar basal body rod protein [Thioalkalivibrio denitrificans]|uniref:Flagellar protein FliL n=1 Tax=Thioalkalivibrio denitrificans TaxID=108003 RepID=A0A1V3NAJ1_9GAMM|nr:flagellar basal body-associated FliL family protein [Thioalkalivibrio denitrificans]OOG22021.1 flagellar basal body rod protein [Thioalkalivibrio denitrificans]
MHPLIKWIAALALLAGTAPLAAAPDGSFDPYVALSAPVVVNLANPQRATYLQIAADLQVESETDKEVVNSHMPVIRDTLIMVFSGREPSEVREAANREALREEALVALREALQARSGRPAVNAIYFSSFLVQ